MKLNRTEPKWLLTLILGFHITSTHVEASHDDEDDVRILIVGMRGDSRFSAADLLSGRKDGGQEDREIVKTPVITDEGRRMMLVTGPNLCEDDTARQSFTTALFLSSPGPHAVLVLLNLQDQEPEECDVVKRVQELLGAEVLQYCIVLLDHQERLTGASRRIAEMINACGGRFHMIRDSEPKPAQTAALIAEIHKLVWLNAGGFYSVLNDRQLHSERLELMKKLHEIEKILTGKASQNVEKFSVMYETLGGVTGIIGWISLVSLTALVVYTEGKDKMLNFGVKFVALVLFMVYLRHVLSPDVAIPLNLALITSLATKFIIDHRIAEDFYFSRISSRLNVQDTIEASILYISVIFFPILFFIVVMFEPFVLGSSLVFGTVISVRSWSDVLIACHAAPGVTIGACVLIFHSKKMSRESLVFVLGSFLCCIIGATLSKGFVTVFALLGVKMTIMFLISGLTMAYWHLKHETLGIVILLTVLTLFFPCGCVLTGSVFLILGLMMSFLKVLIESLVSSYLFYVALFLGALIFWRRNSNNTK